MKLARLILTGLVGLLLAFALLSSPSASAAAPEAPKAVKTCEPLGLQNGYYAVGQRADLDALLNYEFPETRCTFKNFRFIKAVANTRAEVDMLEEWFIAHETKPFTWPMVMCHKSGKKARLYYPPVLTSDIKPTVKTKKAYSAWAERFYARNPKCWYSGR